MIVGSVEAPLAYDALAAAVIAAGKALHLPCCYACCVGTWCEQNLGLEV
jgi:hypothetical protein